MQFTIKRTPNTGTIHLSFSLVCTICVFLLVVLSLLLIIVGLAGQLLGPVLFELGRSLLQCAGLLFLLIVAFRILKRTLQTLLRTILASSFAAQIRPWILWIFWLLRLLLAGFIRWYLDQERKWGT